MDIKSVALDLDGTLSQHRSVLEKENRSVLETLSRRYDLVMVGAGSCLRIFNQMGCFPLDIIGNYGMELSHYDCERQTLVIDDSKDRMTDKVSILDRVAMIREQYGYCKYHGDSVEFFDSGMVCIPLLGTKADITDKLIFDSGKQKRRAIYQQVCDLFPEYRVFIGGSSSFDLVPSPYDKYHALAQYCMRKSLNHDQIVYFGDDIALGGGDYSLYHSDFPFVCVDDYHHFKQLSAFLLE